MAMSNRERVGRGLEILAAGLGPFVDERMTAAAPANRDWVGMLQARDAAKHGREKQYSKSDPQFLLQVITEEWRAFRDHLSRAEQSFASELRDTRNRWAHGDAFSADDTYRALDTMERLLTAVDATDQATEVRRLRLEAQRSVLEAETRRTVRSAAGVEGLGLKPWREVIRPHADVASGNFSASEFAADLYFVSHGEGSRRRWLRACRSRRPREGHAVGLRQSGHLTSHTERTCHVGHQCIRCHAGRDDCVACGASSNASLRHRRLGRSRFRERMA